MNKLLYEVEREYPVQIETLWNAWVKADQLQKWYSGYGLEIIPNSATSDAVIGGDWSIAIDVSANGFVAYFWGKYTEVLFHKKLVHTMFYSQDQLEFNLRGEDQNHHLIEIEFEARNESSWVKFSQFGSMDQEEAEAARDGMESYFDSLGSYLLGNS